MIDQAGREIITFHRDATLFGLNLAAFKAVPASGTRLADRPAIKRPAFRDSWAGNAVHQILSPEEMAAALLRNSGGDGAARAQDPPPLTEDAMQAVFRILREQYGIDFSHYKPSTVMRRIERRLQMAHAPTLESYVDQLRHDSAEVNSLYQDLLIGVTSFFRDREAFATLERDVIPQLLESIPIDQEIRFWVAGCATGEEAYSLAILAHQYLKAHGRPTHIRIFATDVHPASLETASLGIYTEASLADLDHERLNRYFVRHGDDAYQVSQELRKLVVFAPHNVVKDAPFTKLDLITCRNLLIYLQPGAQKKALSLFHFALKAGSVLFLGPSESPGDLSDEFETINSHWKIYRKRRDIRLPADMRLPLSVAQPIAPRFAGLGATLHSAPFDLQLLRIYDALLADFIPPSLLMNDRGELIHSFGGAGKSLEQCGEVHPAGGDDLVQRRAGRRLDRVPHTRHGCRHAPRNVRLGVRPLCAVSRDPRPCRRGNGRRLDVGEDARRIARRSGARA